MTRIAEFPAVWALSRPAAIVDTAQSLLDMSQLLLLTGVVNKAQVLESPAAAKSEVQATNLLHPGELDSVSGPKVAQIDGKTVLRLFLDKPKGIVEYLFSLGTGLELIVEERQITERWLGP